MPISFPPPKRKSLQAAPMSPPPEGPCGPPWADSDPCSASRQASGVCVMLGKRGEGGRGGQGGSSVGDGGGAATGEAAGAGSEGLGAAGQQPAGLQARGNVGQFGKGKVVGGGAGGLSEKVKRARKQGLDGALWGGAGEDGGASAAAGLGGGVEISGEVQPAAVHRGRRHMSEAERACVFCGEVVLTEDGWPLPGQSSLEVAPCPQATTSRTAWRGQSPVRFTEFHHTHSLSTRQHAVTPTEAELGTRALRFQGFILVGPLKSHFREFGLWVLAGPLKSHFRDCGFWALGDPLKSHFQDFGFWILGLGCASEKSFSRVWIFDVGSKGGRPPKHVLQIHELRQQSVQFLKPCNLEAPKTLKPSAFETLYPQNLETLKPPCCGTW